MSREHLEELTDRWINDLVFREEFHRDPEGTLLRGGFAFTPAEIVTLLPVDPLPDQELQPRIIRS